CPPLVSRAQVALSSDADIKPEPSLPTTSAQTGAGRPASGRLPAPPLAASDSDALFLDVDGTLLQIADRPEAVKVPSGMLDVLERLHGCFGGAVALVSGRTIANLDALFAPLRLASAGVHGLQRRGADGVVHHRDVKVLLAP